jgi:hypothetical protein
LPLLSSIFAALFSKKPALVYVVALLPSAHSNKKTAGGTTVAKGCAFDAATLVGAVVPTNG